MQLKERSRNDRRPPFAHVGWREWVGLPDLGIDCIKGKIDTGARTSALHAVDLHRYLDNGVPWVRFTIHPRQRDAILVIVANARIVDERSIRSSSGVSEQRPVIRTRLVLGTQRLTIDLTLTNRADMGFRLLLGRRALRIRVLVDPGRSYLTRGAP